MSDEGVYRTALASQALLNNTKASALEHVIMEIPLYASAKFKI